MTDTPAVFLFALMVALAIIGGVLFIVAGFTHPRRLRHGYVLLSMAAFLGAVAINIAWRQ